MRKKSNGERAVRVNITLPPATLEQIDANVDKLQAWLVSRGIDEKQVRANVSRSSVIKTVVEELAKEHAFAVLKGSFFSSFDRLFDVYALNLHQCVHIVKLFFRFFPNCLFLQNFPTF